MSDNESFDDLTFPEISPELWEELCRDKEQGTSKTHTTEVVLPTPTPAPMRVPTPAPPTQIDEDSDESLWEDFQEPSLSDWIAFGLLPTPPAPLPKPSFIPVYCIGLTPKDLDIEDYPNVARPRKRSPKFPLFREKRSLNVTNVVHPLWCEYKAKYDLVGFKHRPVEQRPDVIILKKKVVVDNKEVIKEVSIRIDKQIAKAAEKRVNQGTAIHKKLEKEIFSKAIPIRPKTPEEHWGLKLLNMIIRIEQLKSKQTITRELSVFGFVDGVPMTGIIDELELQPIPQGTPSDGNILKISDHKTKYSSRPVLSFSREHHAQLMLYKALLDGLLSPNFDWLRHFKHWDLDPSRTFSDPFTSQISELIEREELDASLLDVTTLEGLTEGWTRAVQTLNLVSGQVDSELTVIYRKPRKFSGSAKRSNLNESDIIDARSFEYEEMFMKQILKESLEFWRGQRPLQGAGVDDIWKCESCEYNQDCEWRKDRAAEISQKDQG